MAKKRMFANTVIMSDNFLNLPQSAITLYFILCLTANDNGFNAAPEDVMRRTRTSRDDLEILYKKGFILIFEDGITVVRHWLIHNNIPKDRYSDIHSGYGDLDKITVGDDGTYQMIEIGSSELSLKRMIEENDHALVSIKRAKSLKKSLTKNDVKDECDESVNPCLENLCIQSVYVDKNRIDKNRLERVDSKKDRTANLVIAEDCLYGDKCNVMLFPDEVREIYNTYVDAENLINKAGYIFLNSKRTYKSHYAFIMKIALEDRWEKRKDERSILNDFSKKEKEEICEVAETEQITIAAALKKHEEEKAEARWQQEEDARIEAEMEKLGIESREEYMDYINAKVAGLYRENNDN
ncbi:hypothetical protein M2140_001772 [Clostridiales Family XIII bacterium PM5-7]